LKRNFSLHENYRDEEPTEAGSDRAFGWTVGTILIAIGAIKAFVAGAVSPIAYLILWQVLYCWCLELLRPHASPSLPSYGSE
jgi:hypothetical protein